MVKCDMAGVCLSDVCRDELFACYCECILGINMVYGNTLMQSIVCGALTCNGMCKGQKSFV